MHIWDMMYLKLNFENLFDSDPEANIGYIMLGEDGKNFTTKFCEKDEIDGAEET